MITCPYCQTKNTADARFCNQCGKSLRKALDPDRLGLGDEPPVASILETESAAIDLSSLEPAGGERESPPDMLDTMVLKTPPKPEAEPVAIRLRIGPIGAEGRQVVLPLDRVLHIGRQDPSRDLFPEIDVTDDGPAGRSVSRRHAKISKQDQSVIITDQGSSNGTFVNDKKLKPFEYKAIHSGDTLHLGRLQFQVEILTNR
jgi:hypothetical protein